MYRSGCTETVHIMSVQCTEVVVPKWSAPCTEMVMYRTGPTPWLIIGSAEHCGKSCLGCIVRFILRIYEKAWVHSHVLYTVSHNYGNPWLLYSFWINRQKVIKFSICICLVGLVNAVTFAKTHYWINACSKCPPLALMHVRRRVRHCVITALRWFISSQAVRIRARSSSMSSIRFL